MKMNKSTFEKIVTECWDACLEATGESLSVSKTSMSYNDYFGETEKDVWNGTIADFIRAILSIKNITDCADLEFEFEYSRLSDLLDGVWK